MTKDDDVKACIISLQTALDLLQRKGSGREYLECARQAEEDIRCGLSCLQDYLESKEDS